MAEREGFGGIGRIRGIGDPYDPRRGNPRPQRYFSSKEELQDFLANEELKKRAAVEIAEQEIAAEAARLAATEDPTAVRYYSPVTKYDDTTYLPTGAGTKRIENIERGERIEGRAIRQAFLDLDPTSAQQVLSQSAGTEITPEFTNRVRQYLTALPELDVRGASYLALQESNPQGMSAEALKRLGESGEIGKDPVAAAVARAGNEGVLDDTKPLSDQVRAVDPYIQATEDDKTRLVNKYKGVARETLTGVKAKGSANPINPYLVPALMANATEEYTNPTTGITKMQPATYAVSKNWRAIDPSGVSLELLDPSALISEASAEKFSLAYRNKETGEKERPTLGGAINSLMQEGRTPLIAIKDSDVQEGKYQGLEVTRFGETGEKGYGNYRVGNTSAYKDQLYRDINELLERETGMQLVTNTGFPDKKMRELQNFLLSKSAVEETKNPTHAIMNMLAEGRNIDRKMGSADTNASILATDRGAADLDLYNKRGYALLMANITENAAIKQAASNQPQEGNYKTSSYAIDNAPETPSTTTPNRANDIESTPQANIPTGMRPKTAVAPAPDYRAELIAEIPEAARQNVEGGMNMPVGSPRRKAAEAFLVNWLSKRKG